MIEYKSSKKAEVADLPLKMNLQLFSEEAPSDEGASFDDEQIVEDDNTEEYDSYEDDNDDFVEDSDEAQQPEVADLDEKPKQDSETNKAFQKMRQELEAAQSLMKRNADIARKYGAEYGVFSEEDISAQFGDSHGIHTLEEFEQQLQYDAYREKGIDPDEIRQIVDNHPDLVAARQMRQDQLLLTNFQELQSEYPDLVKEANDVPAEVWSKWNNGQNGLTLAEAYTLVNRKEIIAKQAAAARQATLNNMSSKSHMKPSGNVGTGADTTQIPADVLKMYKQMSPGKPDSYYIEHYKRSMKG